MSLLCRFGFHSWAFASRLVDGATQETHTELVYARCRRGGCASSGGWAVVHSERHVHGSNCIVQKPVQVMPVEAVYP
jgi:hypothetical protein